MVMKDANITKLGELHIGTLYFYKLSVSLKLLENQV